MARYIDADALIKRLGINADCTECSYCTRNYFCSWNPDPGEMCIAISEQPTVTINDLTEGIKVTDCNYKPSACGHENVKDVIYRQDAIDALDCINGVEEVLKSLPSAQLELPKWVQKVERMYNKALTMPYIQKPFAWALYQVWKEYDAERRTDE